MPWTRGAGAGFSAATPWLPIPEAHRDHSVAAQEADPGSTLHRVREFLHWRRRQPALQSGSIRFLDAGEPLLVFVREAPGQRLLAVFNLSQRPVTWRLPAGMAPGAMRDLALCSGTLHDDRLELPASAVFYAELA